ncbi:hypothetical protein FKM82_005417 [Ascaphus truei]
MSHFPKAHRHQKKILACLFLAAFLTSLVSLVNDLMKWNTRSARRTPPSVCCNGKLATDTITPLKDNWTFVISPYSDNRHKNHPVTRVISIIHHEKVNKCYCCFCYILSTSVFITKAKIDIHRDRFGFSYGTADILCSELPSCYAQYVSIHLSFSGDIIQLFRFQIQNRKPKAISANFTVCISTMFGNYSNVLQFIQTIEMYKLLGAQRVTIYRNSCSPEMEEALQYYIKEGVVEVIPWPIQRYLRPSEAWHHSKDNKDIGYYGQITTLNDCIYRNMYRSKFVLLNDLDEIILPFQHNNWENLMESLQKQNPGVGIFLFENHIFPQTEVTNGKFANISSWKEVPGFNILQHIHREPDRTNFYNARKMILNPRKVIQTSVHSVLKHYGRTKKVPLETALVYHCRGPRQAELPKSSLIEDKTIWRFSDSLIENVNKVLSKNIFKASKN